MSLFISQSPLSLLSYHIEEKEKIIPSIYRIDTERDLISLLMAGNPLIPAINIINYKGKPPTTDLRVSVFNNIYLCLSTKDYSSWKELINKYSWISELNIHPELYKKKLQKYSFLFEMDAYDYFWEKYKNYPKKLEAELTVLLLKNKEERTKFSTEDLLFSSVEESNKFFYICSNLGNTKITKELFNMRDSLLHQLFIGYPSKPSYIYYYLLGNKKRKETYPELYQAIEILKECVFNKFVTISIGAILLNYWIGRLDKIKVNHNNFTYKVTYKELNQLENILKGYK